MSALLQSYDPIVRVILQVLLNSLWQGMLIAMLVGALFRFKSSMSATTRHAIWFMSLVTIGVLPFLPTLIGRTGPPQPPTQEVAVQRIALSTDQPIASVDVKSETTTIEPLKSVARVNEQQNRIRTSQTVAPSIETPLPVVSPSTQIKVALTPVVEQSWVSRMSAKILGGKVPVVIVSLWLVVAGFMMFRLLGSFGLMFRMRMNLKAIPDHDRHQMKRLASNFGLKRHVWIRTSTYATVPMTIGLFKPLIVIPEELISTLSNAEFEGIVAHELAHIKRFDYLTNILQRFIQTYMFFHPAVWLIGRFLVVERELACDDWAVKVTGEPRRYASCLTRLVEELRGSKPLAIATGIFFGKHIISRRVEMILDNNRNSSTFIAKPAMVYALGLAFVCVGICSLLSPVIAVPAGQGNVVAQNTQPKPKASTQVEKNDQVKSSVPTAPSSEVRGPIASTTIAPALPIRDDFEDQDTPVWTVRPTPIVPSTEPLTQTVVTPIAIAGQLDMLTSAQPTPKLTYVVDQGGLDYFPQQRAATANNANAAPAISEAELLTVLSDVVKRDADPAVRTEALQGIVRLRSDASITTLISLYDSMADVKVKGEIVPYLLRRKGDNAKAMAKLVAISKTEKDDDLRRSALNQIVRVGGDEAINSLIEIYDSLQDPKIKKSLINSFSNSKNRKAVEKLIQIAKSDSDPVIRQAAIRALSNVDNRMFLELSGREGPMAATAPDGGVGWGTAYAPGAPSPVGRPDPASASRRGSGTGVGNGSGSGSSTTTQTPPPSRTPKQW